MSTRQRRPSTSSKIVDTVKRAEKQVEDVLTVLWDDIPSWLQDNHYITSGYRSPSGSFKKSFASLGYLHNETVNIYTHLLGAIGFSAFALILYLFIKPRYDSATTGDVFAFASFFIGAAFCLGMSATYHTISNHSQHVARIGNKLDYVGIVFLISGSFISCIYYGYHCHKTLQEFYWTMICSLGLGCAIVSSFNRFRTPAWRPYRAGMFVAMGSSTIFPVLHGIELYGIQNLRDRIGLDWILLGGFLYILGAGLYAARWPEKSAPGTFDIFGSSHQIFHVLVVLAATSHLYSLVVAFDYHHSPLRPKC